jgi:flagellar protein FlgJ
MSDFINTNSPRSYSDFAALGELRGKAQRNEAGALRESAQQFEALFIQMMLKSMRQASDVMKSEMFQSNALETFQGMYDKEISMQMAQRNSLGFADVVVKQMTANQATPSTADLLALREGSKSLIPTGMPLHKPVLPLSLQPKVQEPMALPKPIIKPLPINNSFQLPPSRSEP